LNKGAVMNFEEWMVSEGLSSSTVEKYAGALSGSLTKWAQLHEITFAPLEEVDDVELFTAISEKIATTAEFSIHNKRGNQMYSAALHKYAAYLSAVEKNIVGGRHFEEEILEIEKELEESPEFDPQNQTDARKKMLRQIVVRQGQRKFRLKLIAAYDAKCAITHCGVLPILEAAHITPYLGNTTNLAANGILLRSDIHTLWDLGLIAIHPTSKYVFVDASITDDTYRALHRTTPSEPSDIANKPSTAALAKQWELLQKRA
jgi:hypothetical protein